MPVEIKNDHAGSVKIDVDRAVDYYSRRGWAPVPWRDQPADVKIAIRAAGMRPKIKSCFENSQRLVLGQRHVPLTYVEGWVTSGFPMLFEHAWLQDPEGRRVDVTLSAERVRVYESWTVTRLELITSMSRTRVYGPVFADRFRDTHAQALAALYGPDTVNWLTKKNNSDLIKVKEI